MHRHAVATAVVSVLSIAGCHSPALATPPPAVAPAPVVVAPAPAASSSLSPPSAASAPSGPSPPAVGDDGRLPLTAIPHGYSLALTIDPAKPRFSGVTTILVDVPSPTSFVVLNGRDLHITRAVARAEAKDFLATVTSRIGHDGLVAEELVLAFASPLPAGNARIEIAYDAPFAPDLAGVYRVKDDGHDYAFTQFEPTDARRAFPCFDEPGFKTPYDVTIVAPGDAIALANGPEASHADAGGGMVTHVFRTTAPLPSYLVAFAVGDFDIVQGQSDPVPIRLITTHGHAPLAHLALDAAANLLAKLSDYFGMKYPYPKLDLVAVPEFSAAAMENPGLVTFRSDILLLDDARAGTNVRRGQAEVIAHELAHQWFGDLVTMRWWDDVWLNEGFATWAGAKAVDAWKPTFGATAGQIAGIGSVMDADALVSARAVRQPVRSTSEAKEAFDGISYEKGAAVLRMLESWLGPDTFRRGVHRYLHENAWKSTRAKDLFDALDYVSAQKAAAIANGFLDQPGVPEIVATWTCSESAGSSLSLRESEWRPLGEPDSAAPRTWTLPVCIAHDSQKAKTCFTLGAQPLARSLGPRCPAWVYPNSGMTGYYRFVLDRPKLLALASAAPALEPTERVGLISSAWAAVRQGAIEPGVLLDILSSFDHDTDLHVIDEVGHVLAGIDRALVEDGARESFRKYVVARLGGRKRALGWEAPPGATEDDDRRVERSHVLWALGVLARDPATLDEAERYATQWLRNPMSVSSDVAAIAVPLASIGQGAARLLELRTAASNAKLPEDRGIAMRSMGMFDDPIVLHDALGLTLTSEFSISAMQSLLFTAESRPEVRDLFYVWMKDHWPAIRARLPGGLGHGLVGIVGQACTASARDDARAFFVPAMKDIEGAKRPLEEALEQADRCIDLHAHGAAGVTTWLRAWRRAHP